MISKTLLTLPALVVLLLQTADGQVPIEEFFEFGVQYGDAIMDKQDDWASPPIPISITFPFAEHRETTLFVNTNGDISFGRMITDYVPLCGPLGVDWRMIAGFWADIDIRRFGDIYYRESTNPNLLKKAAREISAKYPNLVGINIQWLYIATWNNTAPYMDFSFEQCNNIGNTFQIILATDGRLSFSIFYYHHLTWPNQVTGCGYSHPVKIGFDAGDGENFYALPDSCTTTVSVLETTNTNQAGKWVFRVDTTTIDVLCDNSTDYLTGAKKVNINPTFINVFGGDLIALTGPCFSETSEYHCIFYDPIIGPQKVPATRFVPALTKTPTIYCTAPFFQDSGRFVVEILEEKEDNSTAIYSALLTVALGSPEISLKMESNYVDSTYATSTSNGIIEMTWPTDSPSLRDVPEVDISVFYIQEGKDWIFVGFPLANISNNGTAEINMKRFLERTSRSFPPDAIFMFGVTESILYGYEEDFDDLPDNSTERFLPIAASWLAKLSKDVAQSVVQGIATDYVCWKAGTDSKTCFATQFLGQVKDPAKCLGGTGTASDKWGCSVKAIVSGFVMGKIFADPIKKAIYSATCAGWMAVSDKEKTLAGVPLLPCPPLLTQANADANYINKKDTAAAFLHRLDPGMPNRLFYANVQQSVPAKNGAGQQCSYDSKGQLVRDMSFGAVSMPTGSSWRSIYENAVFDEIGLFTCCQEKYFENSIGFDKARCKTASKELRPVDDGSSYVPPQTGQGKGDPHITTFDKFTYTFNGIGEFWMVRPLNWSSNLAFQMQARTEKFGDSASVFSAFAMQMYPDGSVVQIQLSQLTVTDVLVDGVQVQFGNELLRQQLFKEVSITALTDDLSEVAISFSNGMSFIFSTAQGAMAVLSSATKHNRNLIEGLMGNIDGDPKNDLKTPNGTILQPSASLREIHYDFGLHWAVSQNDSIFTYPTGQSWIDYQNLAFEPLLDIAEPSEEAVEACGESASCLIDFAASGGNVEFAAQTKAMEEVLNATVEAVEVEVIMCASLPDLPNGNYLTESSYFEGAVVSFECDPNFQLIGDNETECFNGNWTNEMPKCVAICQNLPQLEFGSFAEQSIYLEGDKITLTCFDGFFLTGASEILCDNGTWSTEMPVCKAICNNLTSITNGEFLEQSIYLDGDMVNISCKQDYELNGSEQVICLNGTWSSEQPTCLAVCMKPSAPEYGTISPSKDSYLEGENVSYSCIDGFQLVGAAETSCEDNVGTGGKWSLATSPICKAACSAIQPLDNGQFSGPAPFLDGDIATFVCDAGFELVGNNSIECLNGTWSGEQPQCQEIPTTTTQETTTTPTTTTKPTEITTLEVDDPSTTSTEETTTSPTTTPTTTVLKPTETTTLKVDDSSTTTTEETTMTPPTTTTKPTETTTLKADDLSTTASVGTTTATITITNAPTSVTTTTRNDSSTATTTKTTTTTSKKDDSKKDNSSSDSLALLIGITAGATVAALIIASIVGVMSRRC